MHLFAIVFLLVLFISGVISIMRISITMQVVVIYGMQHLSIEYASRLSINTYIELCNFHYHCQCLVSKMSHFFVLNGQIGDKKEDKYFLDY